MIASLCPTIGDICYQSTSNMERTSKLPYKPTSLSPFPTIHTSGTAYFPSVVEYDSKPSGIPSFQSQLEENSMCIQELCREITPASSRNESFCEDVSVLSSFLDLELPTLHFSVLDSA